MSHRSGSRDGATDGAALIVSLLLLAVVMLLATAGWQMGSQEERMVGQQRDRANRVRGSRGHAARRRTRPARQLRERRLRRRLHASRRRSINGETGFGAAGRRRHLLDRRPVPGSHRRTARTSAAACRSVLPARPAQSACRCSTAPSRASGGDQTIKGPAAANLWRPRYVIESLCYHGGGQGMTRSFVASCPVADLSPHRHRLRPAPGDATSPPR